MSQSSHRNWSVIGRHAAKLVTGYEGRSGAKVCGTKRSDYACRSGANYDNVFHLYYLQRCSESFFKHYTG
jgi:hypothetical protein